MNAEAFSTAIYEELEAASLFAGAGGGAESGVLRQPLITGRNRT
jgi:hypothetical protein